MSTRRIQLASALTLLVLITVAPARAAASPILVSNGGGQYNVSLHPSIITNLYFDEPIERVLASDQKHFTVRQIGNAVAIRPNKIDTNLRANVVITTTSMSVTVILRVVKDPAEAQGQLQFKRAEVEQEIQERIEAEVKRRLAAARQNQAKQIQRSIGERLSRRLSDSHLSAIERNDDNIIVRATHVVRLGEDAYLFISVQNRSGSAYRITRVSVSSASTKQGAELVGPVIFEGKAARGPVLGQVAAGSTAELIAVVPGGARGRVTLSVSEASGRRVVVVRGVRLR